MTPLRTENLELKLNNNIAFMSVNGTMSKDSLDEGLSWMDQVAETEESFNICVNIDTENFDDLSAAREEFIRVGRVLRHAATAEKCAILSDSAFLRNSAKIEGAVIPGLEINAFDLNEATTAEKWLKDEPTLDTPANRAAEKTPATPKAAAPSHDSATSQEQAANPWDKLDLTKVDI